MQMASGSKAIVREAIYYGANGACAKAPSGEYEIDNLCDCIRLCKCNGENSFSLSLDAFIQHLNEGRIAFVA